MITLAHCLLLIVTISYLFVCLSVWPPSVSGHSQQQHLPLRNYQQQQYPKQKREEARWSVEREEEFKNQLRQNSIPARQFSSSSGSDGGLSRWRRAATARLERLWDYGVIPYEIESNFSGKYPLSNSLTSPSPILLFKITGREKNFELCCLLWKMAIIGTLRADVI